MLYCACDFLVNVMWSFIVKQVSGMKMTRLHIKGDSGTTISVNSKQSMSGDTHVDYLGTSPNNKKGIQIKV